MKEITSEDLLKHVNNRFLLTVAAAKRSRQLQEGSKPLTEEEGLPVVLTALEEIKEGKISVVTRPIEEEEETSDAKARLISRAGAAPAGSEDSKSKAKKTSTKSKSSGKDDDKKKKKKKSVVA